jgi:hypothetical protein
MSSPAVAEWDAPSRAESPLDEFDYHPVPPLVPVAASFVLLSLTAFLWDVLLIVPALGLLLGLLAVWQVRRSGGLYGGLRVASVSCVLMVTVAALAVGFHAYTFATEVPEGLTRVSFVNDISARELIVRNDQLEVAPEVKQLDGQPVFLKGFMYPTRETTGKTSFVLCKDKGECCFGGQPKLTDMIYVEMKPGQKVDHYDGLVAVGGEFRVDPHLNAEGLETGATPVYKLECGYFSPAKTAY